MPQPCEAAAAVPRRACSVFHQLVLVRHQTPITCGDGDTRTPFQRDATALIRQAESSSSTPGGGDCRLAARNAWAAQGECRAIRLVVVSCNRWISSSPAMPLDLLVVELNLRVAVDYIVPGDLRLAPPDA